MPGADFSGAKLDGATFSCKAGFFLTEYWLPTYSSCWETNLQEARFVTGMIVNNDFDHAKLKDAIFGGNANGLTIVEQSRFFGADMSGVTFQTSWFIDNNFNDADMHDSKWQGGSIKSGNAFVKANLKSARWYGLEFEDGHGTDFTDADLSSVRVSDEIVPLRDDELSENDKRLRYGSNLRQAQSDREGSSAHALIPACRDCIIRGLQDPAPFCFSISPSPGQRLLLLLGQLLRDRPGSSA